MPNARWASRVSFRPAEEPDFDYCATLYFAGMDKIIRELKLDMDA